tara:strand:+ start:515 stop:1066 length:552 start_codon:yes stop_codon:yes gene_type:complete
MAITRLNNNSLTSITALPTAISTGKIGQVLQAYKSDNFETSASSDTDITGLSVAITPTATSSKILVLSNIGGFSHNGVGGGFCINRGIGGTFTKIGRANADGSRTRTSYAGDLYTGDASGTGQMFFSSNTCHLDSPNTTSEVTYKVTAQLNGNTLRVNFEETNSDNSDTNVGTSNITVMEILA